MGKKYLSKLAIIAILIFPFGINSILLSEEKRKSLFDNFAYDTWNDLLKESDKYEKACDLAEEEANKMDLSDELKYLADQKVETLKLLN